jgi:hypothetical protein
MPRQMQARQVSIAASRRQSCALCLRFGTANVASGLLTPADEDRQGCGLSYGLGGQQRRTERVFGVQSRRYARADMPVRRDPGHHLEQLGAWQHCLPC